MKLINEEKHNTSEMLVKSILTEVIENKKDIFETCTVTKHPCDELHY